MSVKMEKAKVSTKIKIDGQLSKVSREVDMPSEAETIEDVLALCDGKLTSARGQKPGLIDAALSGINAFLRREEVKQIELLLGGKDAVRAELIRNMLGVFPNMPKDELDKTVDGIIANNWTEEQEKARQSLKIEKIEKGKEDADGETDGEAEAETETETETETLPVAPISGGSGKSKSKK